MIEKTIYLEDIDPVTFYGANNANIDYIKEHFPALKIIARGPEIKVIGDNHKINDFIEKTELLLSVAQRKNLLTFDDLEAVLKEDENHIPGNSPDPDGLLVYGTHGKQIKAKTPNQQSLVEQSFQSDLLFAIGPAGTGKTYTAIALAVRALRNKEVKRIILTRPAVEAGENLGFLPGDLKEKLDPYLQPLYDALHDMIPPRKLTDYLVDGTIQIAPLAYMRGRTLDNAFVILDEGQNTTVNQLKMFLTRMGKHARFIVTGDITQIDLPRKHESGLIVALKKLQQVKGISTIYFNEKDIIRHRLVKLIVQAYDENEENEKTQ
jgi:phosphate starvation-inducible PhoH-like protein